MGRPSDRGYRLLDCSDGSVSADSFTEVITRYSPGTLDKLPQVTISWFSDQGEQNYCQSYPYNREKMDLSTPMAAKLCSPGISVHPTRILPPEQSDTRQCTRSSANSR